MEFYEIAVPASIRAADAGSYRHHGGDPVNKIPPRVVLIQIHRLGNRWRRMPGSIFGCQDEIGNGDDLPTQRSLRLSLEDPEERVLAELTRHINLLPEKRLGPWRKQTAGHNTDTDVLPLFDSLLVDHAVS